MKPDFRRARDCATEQLQKLYVLRNDIWQDKPTEHDVLLRAPETIIGKAGFEINKVPDFPGVGAADDGTCEQETAAVLYRSQRRVDIRFDLDPCVARFTLAHEAGHILLHPNLSTVHRDRTYYGSTRRNQSRPAVEYEADAFAAELLMPRKYVTRVFCSCFGGPLDLARADHRVASLLSNGTGRCVSAAQLRAMDPLQRARLVVQCDEFGAGSVFEPLAARFRVSETAMARRVVEVALSN